MLSIEFEIYTAYLKGKSLISFLFSSDKGCFNRFYCYISNLEIKLSVASFTLKNCLKNLKYSYVRSKLTVNTSGFKRFKLE